MERDRTREQLIAFKDVSIEERRNKEFITADAKILNTVRTRTYSATYFLLLVNCNKYYFPTHDILSCMNVLILTGWLLYVDISFSLTYVYNSSMLAVMIFRLLN